MTEHNDATRNQVRAARPDMSTWLAANAGSGKTKVLTDRVARLLLDGVEPQRILCLTYTTAAASEMQNRLFQRLGGWAMLEDGELSRQLGDLGATAGTLGLMQARTLFARAIETPGGLKIQTIHSFCASLLRRFPLEAGVSPRFSEIEERAAALLQAEIVDDFADGARAGLIADIAAHATDGDLGALTRAIVANRQEFLPPRDRDDLMAHFGIPAGYDTGAAVAQVFSGDVAELVAAVIPILRNHTKTMIRLADGLAAVNWQTPSDGDLQRLYGLFLSHKDSVPRPVANTGKVPTKLAGRDMGDLLVPFHDLMERVAAAREHELAVAAVEKTLALHRFAAAFLPEYERRKQLRGWLDFDDLILRARQLLNDPAVAAWVLFRLDGGIDHILVDEAQDTSPAQWDVIEKLAREFTAGRGARPDVERTIFVVGDKKQSIYSFQGADPDAFDRMQREFADRLRSAGSPLQNLTLSHSFRSSPAILALVDRVFAGREAAGFPRNTRHLAFKPDLPGRVDLWPVVEKIQSDEAQHWTDPVDRPGRRHHAVILAERIADSIAGMLQRGDTLPDEEAGSGRLVCRPVRPGDFLILVQRRSELFAEIIRACKAANLPIAGADRLKVGAELAVRDMAALLSFLATPEDDLSLAEALKSPLLGWSERMLYDLAHNRQSGFLWAALRARRSEFPETLAVLDDLLGQTDFLRPYDLIERVLTRHRGRRNILARLGAEAEDGINALLSQALAYERSDIPSLTGFLTWMETDDLEVKRQMTGVGNMIRVMTVHGAKGLESPIVILPDTSAPRQSLRGEIMIADGIPVWRTNKEFSPDLIRRTREAMRQRELNERLRLLYVALTRAEKWLIVAAAGDLGNAGENWYRLVADAMAGSGAAAMPNSDTLRIEHGDWTGLEPAGTPAPVPEPPDLPEFFHAPAPEHGPAPPTLSPSDLGGAKALPGEAGQDEEAAKLRGTRLHLLLEGLGDADRAQWPALADRILPDMPGPERASLLDEARGVLESGDLAALFAPGTLAEVPVSADFGDRRLHGTIDRLIVTDTSVRAVDFKSNAVVPDSAAHCPEGLLRQMGAYALALSQVFPGRRIETAIVWTRTATLMELPHDLVTAALGRTQIS